MITVAILVDGKPLTARSAVKRKETNDEGETKYETDAGDIVWHKAGAGMVSLATKILATIKEPQATVGPKGLVVVPPSGILTP